MPSHREDDDVGENLGDNDVEDGNSTDSTELDNDDENPYSDEEVLESRSRRLSFKSGKVGGYNNHIQDFGIKHPTNEGAGNLAWDSDDSVPDFMNEVDDSDQCLASGNSTEIDEQMFVGENFQAVPKVHMLFYKEPNDPRDTHFESGQIFMSREQFKHAVNEYSLATKKDIRYIRNEKRVVSVVCASSKGCKWRIWLGYSKKDGLYHISSMYPKHRCGKSFKSKRISSNWIAKKYFSRFRTQPNWKLKDIQQEIFSTYEVSVSQSLCLRARRKALNDLVGDMVDHYAKLWDYKEELEITNPGSTIELDYVVSNQGGPKYFKAMYICFDALKRGFLDGCRPCIGVDGCFLKGLQKGQLLTCVEKDANDQMYPVAWAVVQVENNETWSWFLNLLLNDLDMVDGGKGWTLISDQQKGLLPAIAELLPNVEHRMCARHIFSNWHKVFKGGNLRMFQLEGLPCVHSMATIQDVGENPENFVSSFLKKTSFMKTYCHLINPLSGEEQWSHVRKEPLLPPPTRRMPGRPKKKRVRDTTETRVVEGTNRVVKSEIISICGLCKKKGHNRRTCDKKDSAEVLPKTSVKKAYKGKSKCQYAKQRNKKRNNPKDVPTTSTTNGVRIEVNPQRSQGNNSFI